MEQRTVATFAIVAAVALVVATVAVAGVVLGGWWLVEEGQRQYQHSRQRIHEEEARERELVRQIQCRLVSESADGAAEAAKAGDVEQVVVSLRNAREQLMVIAAAAAQAGDTAAGAEFESLRQQAESAISCIEEAPEGDQRLEAARAAIGELRDALAERDAAVSTPDD